MHDELKANIRQCITSDVVLGSVLKLRHLKNHRPNSFPNEAMPTKSSIYSKCNPQLLKLFEQAGHPAKVMCVALDYAKAQHAALICNGLGDLLKPSFAVENSLPGAAKLLSEVRACAKQRKIRP